MTDTRDIETLIKTHNIVVFDGVCALCNGWIKFLLRFDRQHRFRFVIAQSELGAKLYEHAGERSDIYETMLVFADGKYHGKADAITAVLGKIGWPWKLFSIARFLPAFLKNWLYDRLANNRYKIFGRYDQCMIPTPEIKARFLD
jgi:predicted DCC family thiol-disulfide oxidoreductase YuxK